MILIGSKAFHYYDSGRVVRDVDLVASYDDATKFIKSIPNKRQYYPIDDGKKMVVFADSIYEIELAYQEGNETSSDLLLSLVKDDPDTVEKDGFLIPSLDVLYLLKLSHRYLRNSPHFLKTMRDIQVMRDMGAKIRDEHREFFKIREKETYNYSHPKLNVKKQDFFKGDGVEYVFDHDTIHLAMMNLEKPAYEYFKPDTAEVFCDKNMFFAAPEEVRLFAVLEESMVLALERSQIPFPDKLSPIKSFDIALMKVCTSITSGFFREYAWENYDKVRKLYKNDYVERFWKAVNTGLVKRL